MGFEASVLRRATRRLKEQRERRAAEAQRRRTKIYESIPQAAEIDRRLQSTVAQAVSAALRQGTDPAPAIAALREENLTLQARRRDLLVQHGWPPDALDDGPACPKCRDSGWVGANMCTCLRELCTQEQIQELSKLLDLGEHSFDRFSLDYYSPNPWPGEKLSPRENMSFIYEVCLNYANRFGKFPFKNLFLTGAPGLGKTFLSACIAREVSDLGFSVVYDTAAHIFQRFECEKFGRESALEENAWADVGRYLRCDLLIMDDLGTEMRTEFVQAAFYRIVNDRLLHRRKTVLSTNLDIEDIARRYGDAVLSRLRGEYQLLRFFGEDIRLLKRK